MFGLLDDRVWYEAQMAADPSGSAYLHDLSHAWLAADLAALKAGHITLAQIP